MAAGETVTLCGIDPAGWSELVEVETGKTNCPLCIAAMKARAAAGV